MIDFMMVESYRRRIAKPIRQTLIALEEHIIDLRDENKIPPCVSKWRIKSVDSIYLKTKIKKDINDVDDLKKITDYGGIRFLVLFEDDLHEVHRALLEYFSENIMMLKEFRLFNWDDKVRMKKFFCEIDECLDPKCDKRKNKADVVRPESGYRSIHYLIEKEQSKDSHFIEIQLRTYLQDVWGELEHSLVYKNRTINQYVRQSFARLAKELAIQDSNVQYLYGISKKELIYDETIKKREVVSIYLTHNSSLLDEDVLQSDAYKEYIRYAMAIPNRNERSEWVDKGRKMLVSLCPKIKGPSENATMWKETEEAYWHFQAGELEQGRESCDAALTLRKKVDPFWGYSIYMRKGESYIAEGLIAKAIVEFDKGESLITEEKIAEDAENYCGFKATIAYHYWSLGPKMYGIALKNIQDASAIMKSNPEAFDPKTLPYKKAMMANNVCWYCLETFIRDYKSFKHAIMVSIDAEKMLQDNGTGLGDEYEAKKKKLISESLEPLMVAIVELIGIKYDKMPSNTFDTISWTLYNLCLVLEDEMITMEDMLDMKNNVKGMTDGIDEGGHIDDFINKISIVVENNAEELLKSKINHAQHLENSQNLQQSHLQEIYKWLNERRLHDNRSGSQSEGE